MNASDPKSGKPAVKWYKRPIVWVWVVVGLIFRVLLLSWASLALYYSNLPWPTIRLVLAIAFFVFGVWALWFTRRRRLKLLFAVLFLGVVAWFISIKPSHHRPWRADVAVMPRAIVDGDRVRFTGFRNFEYRSRNDFTPRYEEREVSLSRLTSADFFLSYWKVGPVGHTFVSFNFEDTPPICISIETRPEEGEGFAPIASMFKQFELIYVVGDERDLVRVRTEYRNEEVYLYQLRIPPEPARRLFMVYIDRINQLADKPEFYHLLSNSCTINIVRYANVAGRTGQLDIRHLLNGFVDRYLYEAKLVDTSLPFEQLRQRSHVNEVAHAVDNRPDFSARIRESLPPAEPAGQAIRPSQ